MFKMMDKSVCNFNRIRKSFIFNDLIKFVKFVEFDQIYITLDVYFNSYERIYFRLHRINNSLTERNYVKIEAI